MPICKILGFFMQVPSFKLSFRSVMNLQWLSRVDFSIPFFLSKSAKVFLSQNHYTLPLHQIKQQSHCKKCFQDQNPSHTLARPFDSGSVILLHSPPFPFPPLYSIALLILQSVRSSSVLLVLLCEQTTLCIAKVEEEQPESDKSFPKE